MSCTHHISLYNAICDSAIQAFSSDLQSLQQRTWFIHWSLFVFFNHPKGGDLIIDMFLVDNKHDNKYVHLFVCLYFWGQIEIVLQLGSSSENDFNSISRESSQFQFDLDFLSNGHIQPTSYIMKIMRV